MALRLPPQQIYSIQQYINTTVSASVAGSTIALDNRAYLRLNFSGSGFVSLENGDRDGLSRLIIAEGVTGSISLSGSNLRTNGAFTPTTGDMISVVWNHALGKWLETSRTVSGSINTITAGSNIVVVTGSTTEISLSSSLTGLTSVSATSFTGSGTSLTDLTASSISNFTNDVRGQFSAGSGISIASGVITNIAPVDGIQTITAGTNIGVSGGTSATASISLSSSLTGLTSITSTSITGSFITGSFITGSFITGSDGKFKTLSGSFITGNGSAITGLTASNISNFTNDVRGQFSAGSGISIASGVITSTSTGSGGDVVGPASATDNAIVIYDGTTGKLVQNSPVTISDDGRILAGTGSAAQPGFSFNGTYPSIPAIHLSSSGMFLNVGPSVIDRLVLQLYNSGTSAYINDYGLTSTGNLTVQSGSFFNPSINFDTVFPWDGISNPEASIIGISCFRQESARFSPSGSLFSADEVPMLEVTTANILGSHTSNSVPIFSFDIDPNTGIGVDSGAPDNLQFFTGGNNYLGLSSGYLYDTGDNVMKIALSTGDAAAPTYAFVTDDDTGIFRAASNRIGYSMGGIDYSTAAANVSTTTNAATAIATFGTTTNKAYQIISNIVCRCTNGLEQVNSYILNTRVKNDGGTVTAVNSITSANEELTTFTVGSSTSGTNVSITVTGDTGYNVTWKGTFRIIEV